MGRRGEVGRKGRIEKKNTHPIVQQTEWAPWMRATTVTQSRIGHSVHQSALPPGHRSFPLITFDIDNRSEYHQLRGEGWLGQGFISQS